MPIIVDPAAPNPPAPVTATSPDGILTVRVDAATAGVVIKADWSAPVSGGFYPGATTYPGATLYPGAGTSVSGPTPKWIRVERDGTPVYGMDARRSPGGIANGWDGFAPLGVPVSWRAIPIYADGSEGTPSAAVSLVLPGLTSSSMADGRAYNAWLKSVEDPSLSQRLDLHAPEPEFGAQAQAGLVQVPGSSYPAGPVDVLVEQPYTIICHTDTKAQRDALRRLVMSGGPMLLQVQPEAMIDDTYVVPVGLVDAYLVGGFDPQHHLAVTVQPITQPATKGSPSFWPGHSYADSKIAAPTYADRKVLWPTYADVWS